jgi:hypothetical protein
MMKMWAMVVGLGLMAVCVAGAGPATRPATRPATLDLKEALAAIKGTFDEKPDANEKQMIRAQRSAKIQPDHSR